MSRGPNLRRSPGPGLNVAGAKARVERAVTMTGPDRVPVLYFNRDREQSDIVITDVVEHFGGPGGDESEWGFVWERKDDTMGQPVDAPLQTADALCSFEAPPLRWTDRAESAKESMARYSPDQYHVGGLALSGFTVMCALRGFENTLADLYQDHASADRLADIVFGFETRIIRRLRSIGFDAVSFFDDWGMQHGMIISPELWRSFFKPRYAKQFAAAHESGLRVYFHSCGYYYDIIPDLIEIGVDFLNISQPNLYNIERLGSDFGGEVCFVCPVSYQTTSIQGTRADIFAAVKRLVDHLGSYNGGLIGYVEAYESIGLSEENYQACVDAFAELGSFLDKPGTSE